MSAVIQISQSQQRRDRLASLRNGFTYISGIAILLLMTVLFQVVNNKDSDFEVMVYTVSVVGVTCSILYMILVPEVWLTRQSQYYDEIYQKKWKELEGGDEVEAPLLQERSDDPQDETADKEESSNKAKPASEGKTPS